jgi:hypothetical protein
MHYNYYNLLAESLIKFNVAMPIKPSAELLALSDPYNPILNEKFRAHDLSLYDGKYYLYFGIVPTILCYLPFKILTHGDLPDGVVVLVFSFLTFIVSVRLLDYLKDKYFKSIPENIVGICIRVLGFCNFLPAILRRPEMYEVAISVGLFFLVSAIYFLLKEINKNNPSKNHLILISSLLGLGCGCRPQIILIGSLLILVFGWWKKLKNVNLLALTLPFFFFLILLGFYNFIRFNNPFDFGLKYQLIADTFSNDFFNLQNIFVNIYFDFFHPPVINTIFPFVHVKFLEIQGIKTYSPGILFALPFLWVNFIFFACSTNEIYKSIKGKEFLISFPYKESIMILIPPVVNIVLMLAMHGLVIRFLADYSSFLILITSCVWFNFGYKYPVKNSNLLNKVSLFLAITSIIFGIAFDIENPEAKITFLPFSELLKKI